MAYYAVIDTNILVSALLSSHDDATTVQVVDKLFTGEIIPLISREILTEYHDVLHRTKFHFSKETVDALINVIEKTGVMISPTNSGEILIDMDDLPFYEVALSMQEYHASLITGNTKHFPDKPFVLTAKEFLKRI